MLLDELTEEGKTGEALFDFHEIIIAIIAVILVVIILMPFRVALVAASTMPVTIFISLGAMYLFNMEINTVTLAALIVTLGMIVDDSIVIIDGYLQNLAIGMSRYHASIAAAKHFFKSIFSATLAISITFFPFIVFMSGGMGEFIASFPVAMSLILFISMFIAQTLVPVMQYIIIRKPLQEDVAVSAQKGGHRHFSMLLLVQNAFDHLIDICFAHKKMTLAIGSATVLFGVWLMTMLPQELMPAAERDQFAVEITTPVGTSLKHTSASETRKHAYTQFLPKVSGSGMLYTGTDDLFDVDVAGYSLKSGKTIGSVGVEATVPVYAGGQINNSYKLSGVQHESALLQKRKAVRDIDTKTENLYWKIIALKAKRSTINAMDSLLGELHRTVGNAVKNGLKNRNDLLKVELRQSENESSRMTLDNALKIARLTLAQHIGIPDSVFDIADMSFDKPASPMTVKTDSKAIVDHMPESQLLAKNVEAKKLEKKIENGKRLPSFALGVGYSYDRFMGESSGGGAVFATVSIPISTWWEGGHDVKAKQHEIDNVRLQQMQTEQQLRINVERLWSKVEEAYKKISIARKSIEQSDENYRLNRNAYQYGTSTMTELLDAELLCQQSKDKYVEALADYYSSLAKYKSIER